MLCSKKSLTKIVGYHQSTCLCVKMAFVVGTISLSCELLSLSCSCFLPCGAGTILYSRHAQHAAHESFLNYRKCCKSSNSNKQLSLQEVFHAETESPHQNEIDFCAPRQKFVLIIWPFELSELCRRGLQEMVSRFACTECSAVEVACLAQNIRRSSASV